MARAQHITRSLAQKEASALTLLRNAFAQGWTSEAMMVDFATAAVQRVWDRHFKIMGAV